MMRHSFTAFLCLAGAVLAQSPEPIRKSSFEDIPAVVLSNGSMELTVLTDGGSLANLTLRDDPQKLGPFWNPRRYAREAGRADANRYMGHFVCVDGFGPASNEEREAGLPGHGEAHALPWETKESR